MAEKLHPMAPEVLPHFIPTADGSDYLFTIVVFMLIAIVVGIGTLYFSLHALPEKMAHRANSTQLQLVGVLSLIALFTHQNIFWVLALLVAAVRLPEVTAPLNRIAERLDQLIERNGGR
ncbi:MAG: hypothetical protein AAGI70_17580 [Pseudomonadota bacterium]